MTSDYRVAIVDEIFDDENSEKPFGKRYRHEDISLTPEQITALSEGKRIALDVQGEYVVYLCVKKDNTVK